MDVKFLSLTSSLGMQLLSPLRAGISTSSQHIILFCSVEAANKLAKAFFTGFHSLSEAESVSKKNLVRFTVSYYVL